METSSSGGSFWIFVLSIFGLFLCQFLSRFSKRQNLCFLLSSCGKNCTRHRSWESNWESHGVSATYSGIKLSYQALSLDSKWCDLVDAKISPSQNVPPNVFSITSHWWVSWKQCDEIITKDADKKKKKKKENRWKISLNFGRIAAPRRFHFLGCPLVSISSVAECYTSHWHRQKKRIHLLSPY